MNFGSLWVISVILLVLSLLIITANLSISLKWYIARKRASMIPFIGGITGMMGLLLLPMPELHRFWWVPLVADLGCGLMLLGVAVQQLKKLVRR
jgi:hypothetical protein